ncbi:MAG: hypothetical protein U0793_29070 [Gemmataceae bacterium]
MNRYFVLTLLAMTASVFSGPSAGATAGRDVEGLSLKDLPEFNGARAYKVDPYIAVAAKLQPMGKQKGSRILAELAKDADHGDKVIVLCRMLFTAKPKGEFRRPLLGGPDFLGGTVAADWPLEPIEIIDGIPFLIVRGYNLGGKPESAASYLAMCMSECDWQTAPFNARTRGDKQKALGKLFASRKWRRPLSEEEKEFLASQVK